MDIYVKASIPETAYFGEAVQWIAFGVVPQMDVNFAEDFRRSEDLHIDLRRAAVVPSYFDVLPAAYQILDAANYGKFEAWVTDAWGFSSDEILDEVRALESLRSHAPDIEDDEEYKAEMSARLREAEVLSQYLSAAKDGIDEIDARLHAAMAKLFGMLAQGKITAEGFEVTVFDDGARASVSTIPRSAWRLDRIHWKDSNLTEASSSEGQRWIGVQIKTADLFKYFPEPDVQASAFTGRLVGGAVLGTEQTNQPSIPRPARARGRPKVGDGKVENAVKIQMGKLLKSGEVFSGPEHALNTMIVWTQEVFGEPVARATVQRMLEPLKDAIVKACAQK